MSDGLQFSKAKVSIKKSPKRFLHQEPIVDLPKYIGNIFIRVEKKAHLKHNVSSRASVVKEKKTNV